MEAKMKKFVVEWALTGNTIINATSPEEAQEKFEKSPQFFAIKDSVRNVEHTGIYDLEVDEIVLLREMARAKPA